ncbi:hypothetical protein Tco_0864654 [Tanacetum coccineum]
MGQLNELLIKSLTAEFSKIVSAHDFSTSLPPTELKDPPYQIRGDLKELLTKLEEFTLTVTSLTSQALFLSSNMFAKVLHSTSKAGDQRVSSAGQASTMLAEGEKNTNQDAEKESTKSDSDDDETRHVPGSMVESFRIKKGKKFDFVTEDGKHFHLTEEQINQQKEIEEEAKAEAARLEGEIRKEELIDLLGLKVRNKYYNDKLQYDRYYDKMLSRIEKSRITNYDILTRKGLITLKVYREDDTSEIIPEFKASDLHLGEWREVVTACPNKKGKGWTSIYKQIQERMDYLRTTEAELGIDLDRPLSEQDPLDRLNDLANKKRKHADDVHDFFRANKRLKLSVQYEDYPAGTVLNEPVLETEEDLSKSFSPAWLTIPSWTMSISLTEVEMKCFTSRRFTRREKDMLYVKKNKADLLGKVTSKVGIEERDIESKELPLPINAKRIEELSYLSNKLNRTAEAEASVLVISSLFSYSFNFG